MALNVGGAFAQFRRDTVDLDTDETATARASRDYLYRQLKVLSNKDDFPVLSGDFQPFGSFARRSKIDPLNDIDLLMGIAAGGTDVVNTGDPYSRRLKLTLADSPLAKFADGDIWGTKYINSTKILNAVKKGLEAVPNYEKAEVRRSYEATVLKLSYDWTFDIVPAVAVLDWSRTNVEHYMIPDGNGNWILTDPRVDQNNASACNGRHNSNYLRVLRLAKYWHRRPTHPSLMAYHFETVCWKTFENASAIVTMQGGLQYFFQYAPGYLNMPCLDPKRLGPNLDAGLSYENRKKINDAMVEDGMYANMAIRAENSGKYSEAIGYWRAIFGDKFPTYG